MVGFDDAGPKRVKIKKSAADEEEEEEPEPAPDKGAADDEAKEGGNFDYHWTNYHR